MEEESTEEETGGLFTVEHVENEDIAMPLFWKMELQMCLQMVENWEEQEIQFLVVQGVEKEVRVVFVVDD